MLHANEYMNGWRRGALNKNYLKTSCCLSETGEFKDEWVLVVELVLLDAHRQ